MELAHDAMVIADRSGKIVLVNSAAEAIFGYALREILGRSIAVLIPERFHGKPPDHCSRFFTSPVMRRLDTINDLCGLRKDGIEFPIEMSLRLPRGRRENPGLERDPRCHPAQAGGGGTAFERRAVSLPGRVDPAHDLGGAP